MSLNQGSHQKAEAGGVCVKIKRDTIQSVALDKCKPKGSEKFKKYDPNQFSDSLYEYNKF